MQEKQCDVKYHMVLTEFSIKIKKEMVLHMLDYHEDSSVYQVIETEYQILEEELYQLVRPVAVLHFGTLEKQIEATEYQPKTPVCYTLFTIGDAITKRITEYFQISNYLAGMLLNAMADDYLFQLDDEVQKYVRDECTRRNLGVMKRLIAPIDFPMHAHKVILEVTGAGEELQIETTEGHMFTSVKTNCYIMVLTQDITVLNTGHDCANCKAINCKIRKQSEVSLKVIRGDQSFDINCIEKESILEALIRHNIYVSAYCGGKGTCGKCKARILEGNIEISKQDNILLTKQELAEGYRLTCHAYPKMNCTIQMDTMDESNFDVVIDYKVDSMNHLKASTLETDGYGIAVDIGTTTIAIGLIELRSQRISKSYTTVNKQRAYGADVISRMQASIEGKKDVLQMLIRKDLLEGFKELLRMGGISKNKIRRISIAGNTTMGHLLQGYSCKTLGIYPFAPVNIDRLEGNFKDIFKSDDMNVPVTLLPGISTFVGADIVAGLVACNFDQSKLPSLFIDLGTNSEMAIGNKDRILVTSTAAGPAFEGGNITCGVGSIAGAICHVTMDDGQIKYETVNEDPPIGICGTGVIELVSELLKAKIMDDTGLLDDEYFDEGVAIASRSIRITQKDIREIQLAKAAVRAGIETLICRYGVTYEEIDTVYLAGGFGYKMNIEKAIHIGLFPKELSGKIKAIGNSSLAGAVLDLIQSDTKNRIDTIVRISEEVNLSGDKDFNELYVNYMFFE